MPDLNAPIPAPEPQQAPLESTNSWDRIIDTAFDEGGNLLLEVEDAPEASPEEPAASVPADYGEVPAADKSYEHVRAWATRASQENSELARKVEQLEKTRMDAEAAMDADGFIDRVASALPEDMGTVLGDRKNFARVISVTARHIADAQTKALRDQVSQHQEALSGYAKALEFMAATNQEFTELQPIIAHAASVFAQANGGARLYDHFTFNDIVTAARTYRDGARQQQTAPPATTAQGQAPTPPTAAVQREARQPTRAAAAAGEQGYAVPDRDLQDLGRARATGRGSFMKNVDSIIDGVLSNPVDRR